MGTQTMGSRGGNSMSGTQEPKSSTLTRQGSLYSLTLDEVQHQLGDLGKPLSSMNLDELLKTVWTAEANQATGGMDYGPSQQQQQPGQLASASALPRQSSLTLTRDLSKKTVDEVWQDIQQGQKRGSVDRKAQERQPTLGEITLEDFLVKAGVVAEMPPTDRSDRNPGTVLAVESMALPQQTQWAHYQLPGIPPQQQQNVMSVFMPGHPVQQPIPIGGNAVMEAAYPDSQMNISPTPLMGTSSDTQTPGRKRVASGDVVEKTVERRQKRMIKNRESAARSRARKQAYTHELENKVSRLEEENERLKRQREMEKMLHNVPPPEPKYKLRRTNSAPI